MSEITKLPDGSAFWTAEVISEDEAMRLPLEKRPLCYRISSEMYHAVFEAIGAATTCGGKQLDAEKAANIAVDLCFKIAREIESKITPG